MKRQWHRLFVLLAAGVFAVVMLWWFEHSQVYHPYRPLEATGAELGRPFRDVWVQASDGVKLNAWFYPGGTNAARCRVVLVCHGNGGNISHRLDLCRALLGTGAGVFLLDYRGYGRSGGRPSESGTYLDAQAAYHWLRENGFAPENILVYGESLGGAVAAELALREKVGGLILQSAFTSVPDLGAELFPWLPVRWLSRIRYDTLQKLPRVTAPVLVMHSRADTLIPFRHAERNFAAAKDPKLFCELEGDHNDAIQARAPFLGGLEKFLGLIEARRGAAGP